MELTAVAVLIALLEFMVLGAAVGWARSKYGVVAPATTGHEVFERYFRVHYNTMENLVVVVPAAFAFAYFVSDLWAAALVAVFVVARIIYFTTYTKDPSKRGAGALPSFLCNVALVIGSLVGALQQLL